MNAALAAAAVLAFAIGAAHSYLGERYILIRLLRRPDLPRLFGSDVFTRRTLRFAWHLTTIAWWGLGMIVLLLARLPEGGARRDFGAAIAAIFLTTAVATLAASRARHLAWIAFLAIALAVWHGSR